MLPKTPKKTDIPRTLLTVRQVAERDSCSEKTVRRAIAAGLLEANQLSARIFKRIRTETGFEVNAHLFRHLAVMIWLDANPGGYEVARRLLGHSDISKTISLYCGLEVKSATRAFADLIATKKGRRS